MTAQQDSPRREGPRQYLGWQAEKVAFLFGMSAQRAALIAAAVLTAIWPVAASRPADGLVLWPLAALLTAAAFVRLAGRTADEWVSAATSWGLVALRGQHKFASAAFAPAAKADPAGPPPMDLPGILAPLKILTAGDGSDGPGIAIVRNARERTCTAVARVQVPGIGLVDSARRDQRVNGWGALLASLCREGHPVTRVQALQRIVPESGAGLRQWHAGHLDPDAPALAADVTSGLLATSTLASSQRESYLAFTMDERRAASQIKAAGGGEAGACTVLARHLRALAPAVTGADLRISGWLAPRDLAEVLRTAFDPDAARELEARRAAWQAATQAGQEPGGLPPGVPPQAAGPAAAQADPGRYVHDGGVSVTYWIQDWPRHQVYATALMPLLAESLHRRSFSIHAEPLGPRSAERHVMRERTARDVAIRMRQRTGQVVPEHERQAMARAQAQDAERAAGHGLLRFTGFVTVTVTDRSQIDDGCAALEADAAAAGIEARRMWFAQDIGFAVSALPLGMGVPRKRW
jgi:hypothetical protein